MCKDNNKLFYIIFETSYLQSTYFWKINVLDRVLTQTPRHVLMCKEFKEELTELGKRLVQEAGVAKKGSFPHKDPGKVTSALLERKL